MVCFFKKTFLKDLADLPTLQRKKIEQLVFEDIPATEDIVNVVNIKKIQGYEDFYRIRIGNYRIGCELQKGNRIVFYRVKNRKDIYKIFP